MELEEKRKERKIRERELQNQHENQREYMSLFRDMFTQNQVLISMLRKQSSGDVPQPDNPPSK